MTGAELLLVGAMVAGGASAIQQGRIAEAQGSAANKIAQYNAKQAELAAKSKLEVAKINASRFARKASFMRASNIAAAAKGGFSLGESPSMIDVLADSAYQMHIDTNVISQQGMVDFVQMNQQASLLRAEGAFAKSQGKKAEQWGYISGGLQLGVGVFAGAMALKPASTAGGTIVSPSASSVNPSGASLRGGPISNVRMQA